MATANEQNVHNRKQIKVAIITDSRGAGLQSRFDQMKGKSYQVKVLVRVGKGVTDAVKDSRRDLDWMGPDIIIVIAGICDITTLDRRTRTVSITTPDENKMVEDYKYTMEIVQHHIKVMSVGNIPILSFGQLIGMDLAVFNHSDTPDEYQQSLDTGVLLINAAVAAFNNANGASTPWLASEIHHNRKNGRKITRYHRLAEDGIHLTNDIRDKWVVALDKAILKMIPK